MILGPTQAEGFADLGIKPQGVANAGQLPLGQPLRPHVIRRAARFQRIPFLHREGVRDISGMGVTRKDPHEHAKNQNHQPPHDASPRSARPILAARITEMSPEREEFGRAKNLGADKKTPRR